MDQSYPIYLLRLGNKTEIIFPQDKADLGHTEFWEQTVSHLVARHFNVSQKRLVNLPYCQRRARIVGNTLYYGEKMTPALLNKIRKAVGNKALVLVHDDHERRLRHDIGEFRRLVGR